ncbi:hypothetical protein PSAC2689_20210 [Paraburkholderia sacchari]
MNFVKDVCRQRAKERGSKEESDRDMGAAVPAPHDKCMNHTGLASEQKLSIAVDSFPEDNARRRDSGPNLPHLV